MKKAKKTQVLLLENVVNLGLKGEVVFPKRGFAYNFLLPKNKAVIPDKRTLRMQEKLQEERKQQDKIDRENARKLADSLKDAKYIMHMRHDSQGHLYGSVNAADVVQLLASHDILLEKKQVILPKPIKVLGNHSIRLQLHEGIEASFILDVQGQETI